MNTPMYQDQLVAIQNQRLWWLLCGAAGMVVALSLSLCVMMLRPHGTPYVIEVNPKGQPIAQVNPLPGAPVIAQSTIKFLAGNYIENAFRITPYFQLEQEALSTVYARSSKETAALLTNYYHANNGANNPLSAGRGVWQTVRIDDTLKLATADMYQVDYTIFRHDKPMQFDVPGVTYRATMRVLQGKPTDGDPLGLIVTDLDFQKEA